MRQLLALSTSILTLVGIWLVGNKDPRGWVVGLGNQVLWISFIVVFQAWGLLPLTVALIVAYTRNLLRWRREAKGPLARLYGHPEVP